MKVQPLEFEKPIVELEEKLADLKSHSRAHDVNLAAEVRRMEEKLNATRVVFDVLTCVPDDGRSQSTPSRTAVTASRIPDPMRKVCSRTARCERRCTSRG